MLREELIKQIAQANVYPIFFGSAMTGIGVSELLENISTLLPAHNLSQDEKLSGIVFKIEREPSEEKIAYVRVFLVTYTLENMLIYKRDQSLPHKEKIKKCACFIMEMLFKLLPFLAENFAKCGD